MGPKKIQKSLKLFTKRVTEKYHPEQVILFGSFARGQANDYSDVDIAVISKDFEKIPQERRLDVLYDLTSGLHPDFHVFGFTPKEFDKLSPFVSVSEAKEYGIRLFT
ncbi:nucleotidyltransferase domain-containing protein [Candidatus Gottesmanbacteria bacterium]|nr:nucleotidyltransferase domain-containing protein [Candidatus Gottesmanbacteria bacterium]